MSQLYPPGTDQYNDSHPLTNSLAPITSPSFKRDLTDTSSGSRNTMDNSARNSVGDEEKDPIQFEKQYDIPTRPRSLLQRSLSRTRSQTEANIFPVTADQTDEYEQELEQEAREKELERQETKISMMDPRSFPDGGLEAWLVIVGGWCCLFCSFGWINCEWESKSGHGNCGTNFDNRHWYISRVLPDSYVEQLFVQYHRMDPFLGNIHDVLWSRFSRICPIPEKKNANFQKGPIVGKIFDNYGPRYLLLTGSFLHVFGLMMTSLSTKYYQFILAQGICSPLGASMIFYPGMSSAMTWFFHRRALALGIVASGSSMGGVVMPIMVNHLITELGFAWSMRISGFLFLFLLIIANLTVKSRIPPHPKTIKIMDFIRPLSELPFLLLVIGSFFFFFGMFLPFNYIILDAIAHGMSANLAGYLVSILNAVSIFGRTIPGYLGDRFGRFNVAIICNAFAGILVLALWLPATGNAPVIVFAALFGFASGAFVSLTPACIAQISDIREIGTRNGSLFAIVSVAALVGSPIGGAIQSSQNGSFKGLQIFSGVMMMAGSVFFCLSRIATAGFALKKI
ncbi:MAG: hypothetical protein M1834_001481 [Cirrosporium novae-zelandiae]|nr:MAG: hypothetical protein M1834_008613 [Cirrosporium novae-zelandiae]KAI9736015.1 MAG: hypothetical protein M1834_001481 [Cirrosporium novae-zelandiae]